MEFDFIYLPDSRIYQLKLPMEQHAIQRFLLDEFEHNAAAYQPLMDALTQLGPFSEYQFQGREYLLKVERQEVLVCHHSVGIEDSAAADLAAELTTDDSNLTAECGLEDLLLLLGQWQQFLPSSFGRAG